MKDLDIRFLPLIFLFTALVLLLSFTISTNYNMTGYSYYLNEETMVLTVEKGFLTKEMHDMPIDEEDSNQVLRVMLSINEANRLWEININIMSLFIAMFVVLFHSTSRPIKKMKWYKILFFLSLAAFIIWDIIAYKEVMQEITKYLGHL